jgi:hypothetical protein
MKTAHQGMGISAAEKNQLLGVLGPMQGAIVEKR